MCACPKLPSARDRARALHGDIPDADTYDIATRVGRFRLPPKEPILVPLRFTPLSAAMNGQHSLDPARIRSVRARFARLVDRYETSVVFLVVAWTVAFLVRSRLAQTDRLSDVVNEALLSLLFVVPIMLIAWAALAVADRRFKLGLLGSDDRR